MLDTMYKQFHKKAFTPGKLECIEYLDNFSKIYGKGDNLIHKSKWKS